MRLILHTCRRVLRVPLVLFVVAASTAVVLSLVGLLGNVPLSDVAPIAVVTAPQIFAGSVLWIRVTRGRDLSWPEVLGVGLVLGPTLFSVVSLVLRLATNVEPRFVALAALGVVFVLGLGLAKLNFPDKALDLRLPKRDWAPVFIALPVAVLVLERFWRNVNLPLQIDGWGTLGGDAAFDVASSKSIALLGLGDKLLFSGQPFKYHFLSQAWAGFTDAATSASPFVVVTRTGPLLLSVGILLLIWAWIRIAAADRTAAWLALAASVTGGFIYVGAVLTPVSLTQLWGSALALVVVLIFTRCLLAPSLHLRLLLVGMAIPMVLAKSTTIILLPALVVGAMTVRDRNERIRLTWVSAAALAAGALTLLLFAYGYGNGLYVTTTQTAQYLGLNTAHLPVAISLLLLTWILATPWIASTNILWIDSPVARSLSGVSVALGIIATLSTSLTGQSGQSQIYFVVTAAAILVPMSAWGVTTAIPVVRALPARLRVVWAGTLISACGVWIVSLRSHSWTGLLVAILLSLVAAISAGKAHRIGWSLGRLSWVAATATLSLSFLVASGILNWTSLLLPAPQALTIGPSDANSISSDQISAVRLLERLNPDGDLVASNFLCDRPEALPPDCVDIQFPVAALAGQRMLVEGSSYSVTDETRALAQDLRQLQHSFSVAPDAVSSARLWDLGVRWLFVDRRRTLVEDWRPFGEVVVKNPDAFIVRLDAPT